MQFLDLFKKSSKKDMVNRRQTQPDHGWIMPLASKEVQKMRYDAAMEILTLFQERMHLVGRKPHPGTVLSTVARLAGTNLFRTMHGNKEFPASNAILSE